MDEKFFKNTIAIFVIVLFSAFLIHGYFVMRTEVSTIKRELREQEMQVFNLKEQLKQFQKIGVEIRVLDLSDIRDVVHVSMEKINKEDGKIQQTEDPKVTYFFTGEENILMEGESTENVSTENIENADSIYKEKEM